MYAQWYSVGLHPSLCTLFHRGICTERPFLEIQRHHMRPTNISVNILCHDVEKILAAKKKALNPHNFGAKIPGDSTAL